MGCSPYSSFGAYILGLYFVHFTFCFLHPIKKLELQKYHFFSKLVIIPYWRIWNRQKKLSTFGLSIAKLCIQKFIVCNLELFMHNSRMGRSILNYKYEFPILELCIHNSRTSNPTNNLFL